jgi:phospholipid transport system substrate-binding protein
MKKVFLLPLFVALATCCGLALAQTAVAAPDTSTPDGLVKSITADVMNTIKADPSIQKGDINKISALVNQKILPYTDFQRTTRLAMGRAWLTATPDQRNQVVDQFKLLLTRTYAGALAQVRDQRVDYKPLRAAPDATDAVVQSQIIGQGQPVQLDYRLTKTANGWRVYDINVLGAWLVPAYQQQFTEQINQHGIDGLIQFLTQRNQQLASGK